MIRIAHIIATFRAEPSSVMEFVQSVTAETMRRARATAAGMVDVALLTAQFPEDRAATPQAFHPTTDLLRSVLNQHAFAVPRRLPLLCDVLDRMTEIDTDYCIYTNVDIALQPHFYLAVRGYIERGFDAFVINRRSIYGNFTSAEEIPRMQAERGSPHPGYDCFVFRREHLTRFVPGRVCLGIGHVDLPLVCSMIAAADCFGEFRDEHLTFHLGDDRVWQGHSYADYRRYNDREALMALRMLALQEGVANQCGFLYRLLLALGLPWNRLCVREWTRLMRASRPPGVIRESSSKSTILR
ncbi:hypothetical protein HYW84_02540 [Candidatus Peregrinibacteria bacterium]|nr:hypothetical protein [Candidatus Peregrinibacteria bacterium]